MTPIEEWLGSLGLSEYADRFAENRIDLSILQDLTDQDLKDIGVVLGDRRGYCVRLPSWRQPSPLRPSSRLHRSRRRGTKQSAARSR